MCYYLARQKVNVSDQRTADFQGQLTAGLQFQ